MTNTTEFVFDIKNICCPIWDNNTLLHIQQKSCILIKIMIKICIYSKLLCVVTLKFEAWIGIAFVFQGEATRTQIAEFIIKSFTRCLEKFLFSNHIDPNMNKL